MEPGIVIVLVLSALLLIGRISNKRKAARQDKDRRERAAVLMAKYNDTQTVEDILKGIIRQGMTAEMVIDSWGQPAAIDERVYKTKISHVFKYHPGRRRSFNRRVMIENGIVIGWQHR